MKPVIILGCSGNCVDILDTLIEINSAAGTSVYECLGFLDDDREKWGAEIFGYKVLGALSTARSYSNAFFVLGVGSPLNFRQRHRLVEVTGLTRQNSATLVHPSSSVSRFAKVGMGTVVFQNVTVASGAKLGDHVLVLPNSVISHETLVGDYTCVAGGVCVSGNVNIAESCYLGTNSSIIGHISIGAGSLVGMGAVVLKDVPANSIMVGNPARLLRNTIID